MENQIIVLRGKALIQATKIYANENKLTSWFQTLITIFLIALAMTGTILLPGVLIKAVFSLFAGLLLVRMFIIYHDFEHRAILNHSKIASLLMKVFGILILSPTSIWKRSHDHHHKHNSKLFSASIGSFPIATKVKYQQMSRAERFGYLAVRHPITIALGYFTMFIYGMCISSFISSPKRHWDSMLALVLHFATSTLVFIFLGWQVWMFFFFFPFLIAFATGSYLFYAQHNFPGVQFAGNNEWAYEKAAMESSSYMKMNPLLAWMTGNIGYHHIHHLNARIPFYRLPEVMHKLPELQNCKTTSLRIKDIIACLRLKVWDAENDKMIGLRGLKMRRSGPGQ